MIDKLIAKTFGTRDYAHQQHLAAKGEGSYARHVALGEFYAALVDQVDEIVEVYQGFRHIVSVGYRVPLPELDIVEHLKAEAEWIAANRNEIADGIPSVLNLVDELHGIYGRTLYKLRNLR